MNIEKHLAEEELKIAKSVRELSFQIVQKLNNSSSSPLRTVFHHVLYINFVKMAKSQSAIICLSECSHFQDALILSRCIIEQYAIIEYIFKNKDQYAPRYLSFANKSLWDKLKIYAPVEIDQKTRDEMEEAYKNYQKEYPSGSGWSGKTIEQVFRNVGMSSLYDSTYRLFSDLVHSNVLSYLFYTGEDDERSIYSEKAAAHDSLIFSSMYLLLILKRVDEELKLDFMTKINDLVTIIKSNFQPQNKT